MKKPNIFLAILTGFGFIVLSIICGLGSSLSLRIIDVLLLFTPIIFVLGLLCYYSFYYKSVKKIFWVSVCLTILAMLYTYHKDEIEEAYIVWQSRMSLPKNLKHYPELSRKELTEGKNTITPLYERGEYSLEKKFFNDQYQLVTFYKKSNSLFYFLKFDTSGKIIDSLSLNIAEEQKREFYIKDKYIIDTYTFSYSTWAIDGNSEFRPMKAVEDTDLWKEDDVKTYIAKNHLPTPTCYKIEVNNIKWRPDKQKYYTTFNYESIIVFIQDEKPHYICSTHYISSFKDTFFERTPVFPLFMKLGNDDFYYSDFQDTYTRRKILPQYFLIEGTLGEGGEGKLFMQLRLNNASISFKVDTYMLTSEDVALKTPTYYLSKDNEEFEKFKKVDLYSNQLLQYQLLSITGRLYMVK